MPVTEGAVTAEQEKQDPLDQRKMARLVTANNRSGSETTSGALCPTSRTASVPICAVQLLYSLDESRRIMGHCYLTEM